MPPGLLLVLVIGGIAGIALLLQLLGYSRRVPFTEDSARAAWARQEPDTPARAIHLSSDGMAALVETDRGPALVWHMGADSTAHWLDAATCQSSATGLTILIGDFAAPRARVALPPDEAARWTALIGGADSSAATGDPA